MASFLEMSDWGGTDAESLERGITHIFSDTGSIPLDVEDFNMNLYFARQMLQVLILEPKQV